MKPTVPGNPVKKSTRNPGGSPSPQEINTLLALFTDGRYPEAATLAQTMTERFPRYGFGWMVLGSVFKQLGRNSDALAPMRKSAALSPQDAAAHNNLGVVLKDLGQLDEAAASYRRALAIKPDYAAAHSNLGVVLHDLGHADEAVASYRRALTINPEYAEAHLNLGIILNDLGQLDEAAASCRRALAIVPDYAAAHYNLGNALNGLGQLDAAAASYRQALAGNPDYAEAHCNLGVALNDLGQPDEAVASYRRALAIKPDYAEAHCNLGVALNDLGQLDEAVASYRRALAIKPDFADAHSNLGIALKDLGQLDEAIASYRRALAIKPDFADAHSNLGVALKDLGQLDEAVASCRRALEIKPDYAGAHCNLGVVLQDLGRLDAAVASYRRALEIKPDFADAHSNLGIALKDLGDLGLLDEAVASCRRALEIKPDYAAAHINLGIVLKDLGQLDEAVAHFRRALEIKPDFAEAHLNLGVVLNDLGQLDDAMASYQRALKIKPDYAEAHSNLIFSLDMKAGVDTQTLQAERRRWSEKFTRSLADNPSLALTNSPDPERRLRIGYVSADFRAHSAAIGFGAMLTRFDPAAFDVYAYSNSVKEDGHTRLFRQSVTCWRSIVGLTDAAAANLIRQDGIDILVDLSGYTAGNRLQVFSRKPAPIQITAWGYAGGTGMKAMDVLFSDPVIVPPEDKSFYAEEVRYLPSVVSAFLPVPFPPIHTSHTLHALHGRSGPAANGIVFGSFNRLSKVAAETWQAWAQILRATPASRLVLKTPELDSPGIGERILGIFIQTGIDPARISLLGKTTWLDHVATFNQIDISLDPFPQSGGATTLEGLMMGVPVVTLRGKTFVGRGSASILTTLGLTDWIAETPEQYVDIAIRKAQGLTELAELRQQLRPRFMASIIGDTAAYARAVEREYRQLWQNWCRRETGAA